MNSINNKIVILIPCYNEELTVSKVIEGFHDVLPGIDIYVFDNNSVDKTSEIAEKAGAIVIKEYRQGKGNVIRSMFRTIEADIYILIDGDSTYPAEEVRKLLEPVMHRRADMAVGDRISSQAYDNENKRPFHGIGNRFIRWLINKLFDSNLKDILSGYRVFNRFFVKTFPVISEGFEVETEMTLHALDKKINIIEVPISYKDRPFGSVSKLNTFSDGIKILKTIVFIFKNYKPMIFFGTCSALTGLFGISIGIFPVLEYIKFSYVFKVPSAILAAALVVLSMLFFCCGLILDTIVKLHKENYEMKILEYFERDESYKK